VVVEGLDIKKTTIDVLRAVVRGLRSPGAGIIVVLFLFVLAPMLTAFIYSGGASRIGVFVICTLSLLLMVEVLFRLGYRFYTGTAYRLYEKVPFKKIYVEPHPYLPFIYKRNFQTEKGGIATYPLHKGRFKFGQYTTNHQRFANGAAGDRDIEIPKPNGLLRINCLGASTTGNYIVLDGKSYSYPMELESILKSKLGHPVEVNNCGQGGYNSADILVRFALQIIDTQPDVVIIYHGYNDIRAYLTNSFESDYSHARRNLGETYWQFYLASKIPVIPIKVLNYLINQWMPVSVRNSLLDNVSKGDFNIGADPALGLKTYQRNLQHIIDLCRCNNIRVILSTYCHYLHDGIKGESLHQRYAHIVELENDVMRKLASKNGLSLVDNARLVPKDEKYFVDSVHFTPEGMRLIAKNIGEVVSEVL